MISELCISPCEVRLAGKAALGFLSSGRGGKVLATVTRAVFLLSDQNELFWIATGSSPMHQRCLQVQLELPRFSVGAEYQARDGLLITNSGVGIDFSKPSVWHVADLLPGNVVSLRKIPEKMITFASSISAWTKPAIVGNIIRFVIQAAQSSSLAWQADEETIISKYFYPAAEGIVMACLEHDFDRLLVHATSLVGLGEGLTPAGDDFLAGLFFSLGLLRKTYPELHDLQVWDCSDFILRCQPRTHVISFTLLKDHAEGHTLEPFYEFAHALLADQPKEQLVSSARELVNVGQSTGWYLLSGFLAGMTLGFPLTHPMQ